MSLEALFTFGLAYQDEEDGPRILFPIPPTTLTYETVNTTSETVADGENSGYTGSADTDNLCVVQGIGVISKDLTGELNVEFAGGIFSLQPNTGFALALPNESPDQPFYSLDWTTVANQDGNDGRVRTIAFGVPW